MHENGVQQEALRAISMASYHHAQQNPRAVMHGRELTEEIYDQSRWIVEPFHLFDCCMENDGAAAIIVTSVERARDLKPTPAVVLAAAQGSTARNQAPAHNADIYATSNFQHVGKRLYEIAGVTPNDVDVSQVYENFTGGVMMSIVEHGLCSADEVNDIFTLENFKSTGKLPINTSGGNLAECYMHGLELIIEAARQIRGQSPNQVSDAEVALVASGPMVTPVSSCILGVDR
jgi:acetyl-CoA acetyltransferase